MATLVRRCLKTFIFIGLLYLSLRYIHVFAYPWTTEQQRIALAISASLKVRDPEDVYIPVVLALDLITSIAAYRLIMKGWRWIQGKRQQVHD